MAQRIAQRAVTYVRNKLIKLTDAMALYRRAANIIGADEYDVETNEVLRLSEASGCSAYDCDFVALADFLDIKFFTADIKMAKAFPNRGVMLFE